MSVEPAGLNCMTASRARSAPRLLDVAPCRFVVANAIERAGIIRYGRRQSTSSILQASVTTSCGCGAAVDAYHLRPMGAAP
jgi:hypothetical protein